jgi:cysteinyl-tRNA synthetase
LHELAGELNKSCNSEEKEAAAKKLLASAELPGLLYQQPEEWFRGTPAIAI